MNATTISREDIKGETEAQKRANLVFLMREAAYLSAIDGNNREWAITCEMRMQEAHLAVQRAYGRRV